MKKFDKRVTPYMKAYFFRKFFGAIKISTKFMLGARFRDKNAIFNVIWEKMTYFMIFIGILSEILYFLLVF